jgi:type I restriction enzyme M protein
MKQPMNEHSRQLVQKLWDYCNLLRDDGLSYGDYVEQLTYLLFLKMAHERTEPPRSEPSRLPDGYDWPSLTSKSGPDLETQYNALLRELGRQPGLLGLIFRKAQNRIQDPAKLRRLIVELIDAERWTSVDADVKGDAYEGLLEKNAADTKSGAGQYFTPRALIRAMVDVAQPRPDTTIADPACGTGGFLLAAADYISDPTHYELDRNQKLWLRDHAFRGTEIVDNTARLCAMNLYLHGIGGASLDATPPIDVKDALLGEPSEKVDMVLANPPFGKKSSVTMVGEDGRANGDLQVNRPDFWATTSNKQLNFVQHIRSMLKIGGTAAVVLPDNVLFEGGAGETIRRRLLQECDVHTILRLPTGIFYA